MYESVEFLTASAASALLPGRRRLSHASLLEDVGSVQVAHRAGVLRDAPHTVAGSDLCPDPRHVVALEFRRPVGGEVEQALGHDKRWDELELHLGDVRSTLAREQHGAQLLVVVGALANVLDRHRDGRIGLLEQVDLVLDVWHPSPEGQLGRRRERLVDLLLRNRPGLAVAGGLGANPEIAKMPQPRAAATLGAFLLMDLFSLLVAATMTGWSPLDRR